MQSRSGTEPWQPPKGLAGLLPAGYFDELVQASNAPSWWDRSGQKFSFNLVARLELRVPR